MPASPQTLWQPMRHEALPAISAISDAVHGAYSEDMAVYAERLALYPSGCMMCAQGDATTGYLISHPWRGDDPPRLNALLGVLPAGADTYYLHDIALLPSARGTGAGAAATAFVLEHARATGFRHVTLMAINGADRFWSAQGFDYVDFTASGSSHSYGAGSHLMRCETGL